MPANLNLHVGGIQYRTKRAMWNIEWEYLRRSSKKTCNHENISKQNYLSIQTHEIYSVGPGEMATQLRAHATLLQDSGSVPESIEDGSQTLVTLTLGNPKPSSGLCGNCMHIVYVETQVHTHIEINIYFYIFLNIQPQTPKKMLK